MVSSMTNVLVCAVLCITIMVVARLVTTTRKKLLSITTYCVVFGRMVPLCVMVAMPTAALTWSVLSVTSCSRATPTPGIGVLMASRPRLATIRKASIGQKSSAITLLVTVVSCSLLVTSLWNLVLSTTLPSVCRGHVLPLVALGLLLSCCAWSTTSAKLCSTTASRSSTAPTLLI